MNRHVFQSLVRDLSSYIQMHKIALLSSSKGYSSYYKGYDQQFAFLSEEVIPRDDLLGFLLDPRDGNSINIITTHGTQVIQRLE